MDARKLAAVARQMAEIAQGLLDPRSGLPLAESNKPYRGYSMPSESHDAFNRIVADFYELWSTKFSERHISRRLEQVLQEYLGGNTDIKGQLTSLSAEFSVELVEQEAIVPLVGLRMGVDELQLGRIVIKNLVGPAGDAICERFRSITRRNTVYNEEQKKRQLEHAESDLQELKDRPCAFFKITATPDRACELAIDETQRALDLLRFAIPDMYVSDWRRVAIGVMGEPAPGQRIAFSIAATDDHARYSGEVVYRHMDINDRTMAELKRIKVLELSDVLQKDNPSEFEETIMLAVFWFARAQTQSDKHNALLNLITCLETLLTPRGRDPITASIAEGLPLFIENDFERRKQIRSKVRDLYAKRGQATHGRKSEILESDLQKLVEYAARLIMIATERRSEFENKDALTGYLNDTKLRFGAN